MMLHVSVYLLGVFIASVSQVLLKKASGRKYKNAIEEYLNPMVMLAYALLFITTFMTIFAYREVPLSWGPILEATSYFYVTTFGVLVFKEQFNSKKAIALGFIMLGIVVYSCGS